MTLGLMEKIFQTISTAMYFQVQSLFFASSSTIFQNVTNPKHRDKNDVMIATVCIIIQKVYVPAIIILQLLYALHTQIKNIEEIILFNKIGNNDLCSF